MTQPNPELEKAHRYFAAETFNQTWSYLDKTDRTPEDNETLLRLANTSAWHWSQVGTGLEFQRAEWMLARVTTVLGMREEALRHAQRCLDLTEKYRELLADFDFAFAYECAARAYALNQNPDKVKEFRAKAREAADQIRDPEDKSVFESDYAGGDWYGF